MATYLKSSLFFTFAHKGMAQVHYRRKPPFEKAVDNYDDGCHIQGTVSRTVTIRKSRRT
jgi:hypothetical protein